MNTITLPRATAQQALEALETGGWNMTTRAIASLRAALAQRAEPAQGPEGMVEFLADLQRSRTKYPKNRRMFDGLMGEIDELRRAYAGDGDIRAEAFDVAVCAFRIATEGDAGGNARLEQAESDHETRAELAEQQVVQLAEERDHYRNLWQKAQQAEPVEPVATVVARQYDDGTYAGNALDWAGRNCEDDFPVGTKLYTAPPQRRPLTEEEIAALVRVEIEALPSYPSAVEELPYRLARAVEKASWEKNHG